MKEKNKIKIAPSLAASSQLNLRQTVEELEKAGADYIHFDIEDGNFAPVMTLGVRMIKDLRPLTDIPFDVHLMMNTPEWIIPELKEMGANSVSVHYEACPYPRRTLGLIHQVGMQAGLAFNPATPLPILRHCLPFLSFVLVLTTEPEAQVCSYLPSVLRKVVEGKKQPGLEKVKWEVDGGFGVENILDAKSAGADIIVSGRGVFRDGQIQDNLRQLRNVLNENEE
jgi:ribulose-phosphate 3-epimerase